MCGCYALLQMESASKVVADDASVATLRSSELATTIMSLPYHQSTTINTPNNLALGINSSDATVTTTFTNTTTVPIEAKDAATSLMTISFIQEVKTLDDKNVDKSVDEKCDKIVKLSLASEENREEEVQSIGVLKQNGHMQSMEKNHIDEKLENANSSIESLEVTKNSNHDSLNLERNNLLAVSNNVAKSSLNQLNALCTEVKVKQNAADLSNSSDPCNTLVVDDKSSEINLKPEITVDVCKSMSLNIKSKSDDLNTQAPNNDLKNSNENGATGIFSLQKNNFQSEFESKIEPNLQPQSKHLTPIFSNSTEQILIKDTKVSENLVTFNASDTVEVMDISDDCIQSTSEINETNASNYDVTTAEGLLWSVNKDEKAKVNYPSVIYKSSEHTTPSTQPGTNNHYDSSSSNDSVHSSNFSASDSSSGSSNVYKKPTKWEIRTNKRHEYDFDRLLKAVEAIRIGHSVLSASNSCNVPYHRLYMFMKELHTDSDEEEVRIYL